MAYRTCTVKKFATNMGTLKLKRGRWKHQVADSLDSVKSRITIHHLRSVKSLNKFLLKTKASFQALPIWGRNLDANSRFCKFNIVWGKDELFLKVYRPENLAFQQQPHFQAFLSFSYNNGSGTRRYLPLCFCPILPSSDSTAQQLFVCSGVTGV